MSFVEGGCVYVLITIVKVYDLSKYSSSTEGARRRRMAVNIIAGSGDDRC